MRAALGEGGCTAPAGDRLAELANIGVGHAAGYSPPWSGAWSACGPRVRCRRRVASRAPAPWRLHRVGFAFALSGGPFAQIEVWVEEATLAALRPPQLPPSPGSDRSSPAPSALAELANVLASAAVSAVADQLGIAIVPTPPRPPARTQTALPALATPLVSWRTDAGLAGLSWTPRADALARAPRGSSARV